jgi:hypothetical protein
MFIWNLLGGTLGVAEAELIFSDEDYATKRNNTTSLAFIKVIDGSFLARVLRRERVRRPLPTIATNPIATRFCCHRGRSFPVIVSPLAKPH